MWLKVVDDLMQADHGTFVNLPRRVALDGQWWSWRGQVLSPSVYQVLNRLSSLKQTRWETSIPASAEHLVFSRLVQQPKSPNFRTLVFTILFETKWLPKCLVPNQLFTPLPKGLWGIAIISICLSIHTFRQYNISSTHSWRKVIYYLIMHLGVAKKPIEGEFPWPICFSENGEKM